MTSKLRVNEITSQSGAGSIVIPAGNSLQQEGLVVQSVFKRITENTTSTSQQNYVAVTDGNLSITTKLNNSKILVVPACQGYQQGGSGCNIGLERVLGGVTTRLLGVNGAAGDAWGGAGNGATNISWSITRVYLDAPNVVAGTTIQYNVLLGLWSSGTVFFNYPAFALESSFTLMEIAQ
jgi:hypothetical protein